MHLEGTRKKTPRKKFTTISKPSIPSLSLIALVIRHSGEVIKDRELEGGNAKVISSNTHAI